jgi:hypothetical protein
MLAGIPALALLLALGFWQRYSLHGARLREVQMRVKVPDPGWSYIRRGKRPPQHLAA